MSRLACVLNIQSDLLYCPITPEAAMVQIVGQYSLLPGMEPNPNMARPAQTSDNTVDGEGRGSGDGGSRESAHTGGESPSSSGSGQKELNGQELQAKAVGVLEDEDLGEVKDAR